MEHGDCHLGRTKQRTDLLEAIVTQPYEVVEGFIYCIDALVASSMTRLAMSDTVDNHQSLLSNGRLHACRLADNSNVNLR